MSLPCFIVAVIADKDLQETHLGLVKLREIAHPVFGSDPTRPYSSE